MRRARLLPVALLLTLACKPPEPPAQRYTRFAQAAREGDTGAVWSMLSSASQEKLRARQKELGGAKPTPGVDVTVADLVLGDLAPTAPKVNSVTMVRESGTEAVVAVEVEGGPGGEARLVREGEEWKVVLP